MFTEKYAMGWLRDLPDFRDHQINQDAVPARLQAMGERSVKANLKLVGVLKAPPTLPATTDLRAWCSPIEDQGALGSCSEKWFH